MAFSQHRLLVISIVLAPLMLAACTSEVGGSEGDNSADSQQVAVSEKAVVPKPPVISVKDGAKNVRVDQPVTVTSTGEGLAKVTMVNGEGREIKSKLSADGKEWTTAEDLGMWREYTVTAKDKNGKTSEATFSTVAPTYSSSVAISPLPDSTVGVGQTIGFRFNSPIEDRHAVQDAITIESSPHVDGAFYWISPYEVRWRPQFYWESGTKVKVKADIYGKDLGGDLYGDADNETNFTIGDRVIAIVDDNTKSMQVWRNKKLERTIPVSLGRDTARWATPNGRYIVGDLNTNMVMDSMTYGLAYDQGGYKTEVNYATQLSYSGIYVHAAPWSVWAQGSSNTSHGCINVSTADAQWFQNEVKRGDIVYVKNTVGGVLPVSDGLGDWNMSWEEWSKGNADQ